MTELRIWIHSGRRSSGTFAPETRSIEPAIVSAKRETLRPRKPIAPTQRPMAVQAKAETRTASPRASSSPELKLTSRIAAPSANEKTAVPKPVTIEGSVRPRKRARRLAGEARIEARVRTSPVERAMEVIEMSRWRDSKSRSTRRNRRAGLRRVVDVSRG